MKPITVITPTLSDRVEKLAECKASVQDQTVEFADHIVQIDHDREGPAATRNKLIEKVDTEWVLFLDDDDILYPQYNEAVQPYLDDFDFVYTWCERDFLGIPDTDFNPDMLRIGNTIPVTACVKVQMVRDVGGFPLEGVYEDWQLWLKLLDAGAKFMAVRKRLWEYRLSGEGKNAEDLAKISEERA